MTGQRPNPWLAVQIQAYRELTTNVRRCMLTVDMKMTLGDQLRKLRDRDDLSLRELAKKIGDVTAAHLSDIEFSRRYPSDELLKKLAVFFSVDEAELRALDTRPPVEEIKRLALSDPAFGMALRKLVDKEITPEDVLKMTEGKSNRPKK
jgi:transcriptional regulator with XRE-family HTH domain